MGHEFSVIFDLDGTLIDSQASILKSIEVALDEVGISSSIPLTKDLIGPPLLSTLGKICATEDNEIISNLATKFKEIYDTKGYKHSVPYNGITDLLQNLAKSKYKLGIATNKRFKPTEKILEYFKWTKYFPHIYAIDSAKQPFKNKEETIATLLRESKLNSAQTIYIGDRFEDYQAAIANNLRCILVNWGYGSGEPSVIDCLKVENCSELLTEIKRLAWQRF